MSTFKIILINPNKIQALNPYSPEFDAELKKYTSIKQVDDKTFMETIVKHLQMDKTENEFMGDTELCYETFDKKIYEFCCVDITEKRGDNMLASHLSCLHKKIDGPVVLFGYKVNSIGIPVNISVGYDELKEILINKYIHTGVYIHESGNMIEFTYHNDLNVFNQQNQKPELIPRLGDIAELLKSGTYFNFSVYKYNLVVVVPNIPENEDGKINKVISLFLNKMIAKGNFIILHKVAQNDYTNFSINELKQMVYLYNQKDLKSKDTINEKINNIKVVKNKYMILHNKFKELNKNSLDNNSFNKFVNDTFNIFKDNIKYKNTIFNKHVFKELEKKAKKKEKLDEFLKNKDLIISEEIEINVNPS